MNNEDLKQESELENERSKSEKELNEIKQEHKGRYPKKVAEQAKALKLKSRKGVPVVPSKLDLFIEEYFKNGGNATAAAMVVFNCKSRATASVVGSNYLAKAKSIGRLIMEEEGVTYAKMIRLALEQMQKPKADGTFVALWDRLMKLGGYEDFMPQKKDQGGNTINIMNVQKRLMDTYVDGTFEEGEGVDGEE